MNVEERVPWPFPGPHYDWTTEDELDSIAGQLRSLAQVAARPKVASELEQLANDIIRARTFVVQHGELPEDEE